MKLKIKETPLYKEKYWVELTFWFDGCVGAAQRIIELDSQLEVKQLLIGLEKDYNIDKFFDTTNNWPTDIYGNRGKCDINLIKVYFQDKYGRGIEVEVIK